MSSDRVRLVGRRSGFSFAGDGVEALYDPSTRRIVEVGTGRAYRWEGTREPWEVSPVEVVFAGEFPGQESLTPPALWERVVDGVPASPGFGGTPSADESFCRDFTAMFGDLTAGDDDE